MAKQTKNKNAVGSDCEARMPTINFHYFNLVVQKPNNQPRMGLVVKEAKAHPEL
jgi:hypothetical protein